MKCTLYLLIITCITLNTYGQSIEWTKNPYKQPWKGSVVTKSHGNLITFSVQTINESTSTLQVYDSAMTLTKTTKIKLPDRLFDGTIVTTRKDFFYVFYCLHKGDSAHFEAAKIGFDGKLMGIYPVDNTKTLTVAGWNEDVYEPDEIYSVITSENKKNILVFKINNQEGSNTLVTTLLFNDDLQLQHRSDLYAPVVDGVDFFSNFNIDNDGNLVFIRSREVTNMLEAAQKTVMVTKPPFSDSIYLNRIIPDDIRAADIYINIDNLRKKYIISSFYSADDKRNIDGLYCLLLNSTDRTPITARKITFADSVQRLVQQPGSLAAAFNNFNIEHMLLRNDGGFLVDAGSYAPVAPMHIDTWNQFFNLTERSSTGYLRYTAEHFPWTAFAPRMYTTPPVRFPAGDIRGGNTVVFSFDSSGMPEWIRVLNMSQFDEDPHYLGYSPIVVDDKVYYLYNRMEKKVVYPSLQIINTKGDVHETMLAGVDRVVEEKLKIAPRSFFQVGSREIILYFQGIKNPDFAKITF